MFVLTCGFAFFIQFLPIFLKGEFGFAENGVAGTYAFLGLAAGLTQGVGIRLAGKWMPGHRLLRFTLPLFALSYLALLLSRAPVFFYSLVPFLILFQSLSFPNLLALISNQATATEQGETIGINQSLQSLGSALSAFFAGLSISFDNRLIFVIGFFSASAAALIFIFGFRKNKAPAL